MFRMAMKKIAAQWFGVKTKEQALKLKRRFSIFYAILGWNTFGIIFYLIVREHLPSDPIERRKTYTTLTGTPSNMKVYQITGMTITREFELLKKANEEAKAAKEEDTTAKD